jgi:hypothetical protein
MARVRSERTRAKILGIKGIFHAPEGETVSHDTGERKGSRLGGRWQLANLIDYQKLAD